VQCDPFRGGRPGRGGGGGGGGGGRDPTLGLRPTLGSKIKDGRSSAKYVELEKLSCETIQKEVNQILQLMTAGTARRIILPPLRTFLHYYDVASPHLFRMVFRNSVTIPHVTNNYLVPSIVWS